MDLRDGIMVMIFLVFFSLDCWSVYLGYIYLREAVVPCIRIQIQVKSERIAQMKYIQSQGINKLHTIVTMHAMQCLNTKYKPNQTLPRKHSMPSLAVFALDIIAHVTSQDMLPEHAFNQVLNSPITIITPAHAPHPQGPPNQTDHSLHSSRSSH